MGRDWPMLWKRSGNDVNLAGLARVLTDVFLHWRDQVARVTLGEAVVFPASLLPRFCLK